MNNKKVLKLITISIPLLFVLIYLLKDDILALASMIPPCTIYAAFNIYCPACGNTRSVTALLHGDVITSLRYNIVPILLLILMTLGYIELATYSFGNHIKILPRKLSFYLILIGFVFLYFIIRNFIPYLTP